MRIRRLCVAFAGIGLLGALVETQAATFNVADGDVTGLINAINTANTNGENDTINLAAGGLYTLTTVNVSDSGPTGLPILRTDGGHSLAFTGNRTTITRDPGAPPFRIFQVASNANITFNGITVSGGFLDAPSANDFPEGGGININSATVTLVNCTVTSNSVSSTQTSVAIASGGGIYNGNGTVTLVNSTLDNNRASTRSEDGSSAIAEGGAIYNGDGIVRMRNCTLSSNLTSASSGSGGAGGGGIPQASGGGIANFGSAAGNAMVTMNSCSFVGNSSNNANSSFIPSVGIQNGGSTANVTFGNCLFVFTAFGNFDGTITSAGFNLSDDNGEGFLAAPGDQINANPMVGALANHGGQTRTHQLLPGSPAIDKGKRNAIPSLAVPTDQRGVARPFDYPGVIPAVGGDGSDIGAYEMNEFAQSGPNFTVNITDDHSDNFCGTLDCSLADAIGAANAHAGTDTINFAANVTGTINLNGPLPQLTTDMTIEGPGADRLDVHRNNTIFDFRILTVTNGTTTGPVVTVSGLTLSNGKAPGPNPVVGGGISNDHGTLTLNDCVVTGNTGTNGGGIYNNGINGGTATLIINNSTLAANSGNFGGAIFNHTFQGSGSVKLVNCTVSDNTANRGAAVNNSGASGNASLELTNCTLNNNSAISGGILNDGSMGTASVTIANTILKAGAQGANLATISNTGTYTSLGHNLSSDTAGGDATTGPGGLLNATGDIRNTDPKLDPNGLADNGGPTQTVALVVGSPAINAGGGGVAPTKDQRGFSRNGVSDIGAFEFSGIMPTPTPSPTPTSTPTATATATVKPTATATATATVKPTATATASPTATATAPPTTLGNISTRLRVGSGDNALIGGFIIAGTQPKRLIIRAIGPSLPFAGRLANPTLELYRGSTLLASDDDWKNQPAANRQAVIDSTIPPSNDLESALVRILPANNTAYTAIVRGAGNGTGIGVVEAYDLDRMADSKLANISTRGLVQTGDDVLIAGTIVLGSQSQKVIVRAIGPSLPIAGKLANPTLELRDGNGGLIDANDDWKTSPNKQAIIDSTIPPSNDRESAIVQTLPANGAQYTAIVRGVNNTTGIAVVEIYALQ